MCYGHDGKPHLRIENRVLPAGPTIVDEVANGAFWFGLISGMAAKYPDITQLHSFEDVAMNFKCAARLGLDAQFAWTDGNVLPAARLIGDTLLPLAHEGLARSGIDSADAERYLGIIEARVNSGQTGARWQLRSLTGIRGRGSAGERLNAVTAGMVERQLTGQPVSEWEPAKFEESGGWKRNFMRVEQYMSTDLFTVHEDESLDMVAHMMQWERIRHVPVEDNRHRLVGLVSYRTLLRQLTGRNQQDKTEISVSEVMIRNPVVVAPEESTLAAIHLMRENRIGCLPVVKDDRLVGIMTERDLVNVAAEMLEDRLDPTTD